MPFSLLYHFATLFQGLVENTGLRAPSPHSMKVTSCLCSGLMFLCVASPTVQNQKGNRDLSIGCRCDGVFPDVVLRYTGDLITDRGLMIDGFK